MRAECERLKKVRNIHFIGIGGISMSSLAVIAKSCGHRVSGSDDDANNEMLPHLRETGIKIYTPLSADNIDESGAQAVVFTAAVHESNPELRRAREKGLACYSRAEYLGFVMTNYKNRIGVSGTHGKSTTTAMIFSVFEHSDTVPTLCCGAVLPKLQRAYSLGEKRDFIYEACEYTDSFLHFFPTTALILNIELDHVDFFPSLGKLIESFGKSAECADKVITLYNDGNCEKAVLGLRGEKIFVSPDNTDADCYASAVVCEKGRYSFNVNYKGCDCGRISLKVPGYHNVTNALFAFSAGVENGVPYKSCREGIEDFTGIDRRFQLIGQYNGKDVYIDYAHHPGEIATTIRTARETGAERLFAVFQSHTHTRTAQFVNEFAAELSKCDEVIITSTYAARETTNDTGVTAEGLAAMIPCGRFIPDFDGVLDYIEKNGKENDTYIFMGAGTVNNAAFSLIQRNKNNEKQ